MQIHLERPLGEKKCCYLICMVSTDLTTPQSKTDQVFFDDQTPSDAQYAFYDLELVNNALYREERDCKRISLSFKPI
jgi:hypothetical protein